MALQIPGYRIIRKINQGGMSTVYLAIQLSVDRQVALKVMSPVLGTDPVFSQRFQREANIVGQLSHPNIISIYDIGCYKGLNYIAMDYLAGGSLQEKMVTGLSLPDTLRVIDTIALALDSAHSKGYIHRDIKPENILFREDGSAVLTDFGVARSVGGSSQMTSAGKIIGTPHYMSPEQARGKPLDGRSDLYSLGVVLYEMLTGSVPFQADEAVAIAVKHITLPVPRLPEQHVVLQPLLDKLLAKDPEERFQRGLEVCDAIAKLMAGNRGMGSNEPAELQPTAIQIASLLKVLIDDCLSVALIKIKQLASWRLSIERGFYQRQEPAGNITLSTQVKTAEYDRETLISPVVTTDTQKDSSNLRIVSSWWITLPLLASLSWLVFCLVVNSVQLPWLQYVPERLTRAAQSTHHFYSSRLLPAPSAVTTTLPTPVALQSEKALPQQLQQGSQALKEPIVIPDQYSLTVAVTPSSSRIRILNIVEKYQHGMKLKPGKYHIEVTRPGYKPHFEWLNLNKKDLIHQVMLNKSPEPGQIFQDTLATGARGPAMVVVPQGSFLPGNPDSNGKVTFSRPFAVSQHEITFASFSKFTTTKKRSLPEDNHWGRGSRPVINVSWNDAKAYVDWLSSETGEKYRLPTGDEWEYVARAGASGDYYWGELRSANRKEPVANCSRGCNSPYSKLFSTKTSPVGSFAPNSFHLYDTAGNVAEWVEDCYPQNNNSDDSGSNCTYRTVRGGSMKESIKALKIQLTDKRKPGKVYSDVGFRVVRDLY